MSEYAEIPEGEMVEFLGNQGFQKVEIPNTKELVMGKILSKGEYPICMRIFTSVSDGAGREVGEDAIRCVLVTKISNAGMDCIRAFGKAKRVYRVKGWKSNLQARIDNWEENQSPACPKCGAPMAVKKGPRGDFWGCITWKESKCNGSFSIEKEKGV